MSSSSTDKIKLYTFESNRAGGIISVLLLAKAEFKVKKVTIDEWDEKKEKFHGQTLPILKMNGIQYCNELPTLLYLGRKFNLLGNTLEEEYLTINLLYAINDLQQSILPAFLPETETEYKEQQAKIDELINVKFPMYLKAFEKQIANKKYLLDDSKVNLIDVYLAYFINLIFKHPLRVYLLDSILRENAPNLNNFVTSMSENEMKEYYSNYYQINSPL